MITKYKRGLSQKLDNCRDIGSRLDCRLDFSVNSADSTTFHVRGSLPCPITKVPIDWDSVDDSGTKSVHRDDRGRHGKLPNISALFAQLYTGISRLIRILLLQDRLDDQFEASSVHRPATRAPAAAAAAVFRPPRVPGS